MLERVDQAVDDGGVERDGDEVDEHLAIRGALEQAAAADKLAVQQVRVGQVPIMGDRKAAELEIGVKRLDVTEHGVAGGGVAVVTDGRRAGQAGNDLGVAVIVTDEAEATMTVKTPPIVGDDAGGLLTAMLQGVQTKRRDGRGVADPPNAEDATFLM